MITTRLERIMSAKNILPDDQRKIYDALFVKLKSDEDTCKDLGVTMPQFVLKRDEMVRSLRAISA